MRQYFLTTLILAWWSWFTISMFSVPDFFQQISRRGIEAVDSTWAACMQTWLAGVAISRSAYLWSVVFAPFVSDLAQLWISRGLPIFRKFLFWLWPYLQFWAAWAAAQFQDLPLEISSSLVWIPACLLASRFSRKFLHGLILPLVWISWKTLPSGSRLPLLFSVSLFPCFLSLWRFKTKSSKLLPLLAYWLVFPGLVWLDKLVFPIVGIFGGVYLSTFTALIPWTILTGETASLVDVIDRADWKAYSRNTWKFLSVFLGGGSSKFVLWAQRAAIFLGKFREMSSIYQIGIFIFCALALIYFAFTAIQRLMSFFLWPWFYFEVGKVCVSRSVTLYRANLAFCLLFLGFEFVVLPLAPFWLRTLISFFHLPLAFGMKMAAEAILDFFLSCTLPKSKGD